MEDSLSDKEIVKRIRIHIDEINELVQTANYHDITVAYDITWVHPRGAPQAAKRLPKLVASIVKTL